MQLHHDLRWKELYSEAAELMFIHVLPDDGGLYPDTFWANLHERNHCKHSSVIRLKSLSEPEVSFRFDLELEEFYNTISVSKIVQYFSK